MHSAGLLLLFFLQDGKAAHEAQIRAQIAAIVQSGRVLEIGEAKDRLADPSKLIAPGSPPLLSFRYFQGADRHRFGNLSLVLDDAGH
jgi:hypothetical protein